MDERNLRSIIRRRLAESRYEMRQIVAGHRQSAAWLDELAAELARDIEADGRNRSGFVAVAGGVCGASAGPRP